MVKRSGTLSGKILKELISEVSAMGLKLFKAECMNVANSTVIACARSKEEAKRYFDEYGEVLRCSQLIMQDVSRQSRR